MEDQIYGQIYKMRALDRWENEGGRTESHQTGNDNPSPTDEQRRAINAGQHSNVGERKTK